jgi:hypothetical protein
MALAVLFMVEEMSAVQAVTVTTAGAVVIGGGHNGDGHDDIMHFFGRQGNEV